MFTDGGTLIVIHFYLQWSLREELVGYPITPNELWCVLMTGPNQTAILQNLPYRHTCEVSLSVPAEPESAESVDSPYLSGLVRSHDVP